MTRKKPVSKGGPFREAQREDHHIVRIDDELRHTHCWKLALRRRRKYIQMYFSDGKHGGKRKAFLAAKACRDRLMAETSTADYAIWRRNRKEKRNTSGEVGIGRYIKRGGKRARPCWQAFWRDADNIRHIRSFGVQTHGERRAKALASAARRKAMEEVREELERRGVLYGA